MSNCIFGPLFFVCGLNCILHVQDYKNKITKKCHRQVRHW